VRFQSPDGEVEGALVLRLAPPGRAWAEVRTRALFGLVGERVVVSLPGDGHLVSYREREDRIDRIPIDASVAGELTPAGDAASLLAWALGRVAWGGALDSLLQRAIGDGRHAQVQWGDADQVALELDGDGRLRSLAWRHDGDVRLDLRYERWLRVGEGQVPTRVRARAPAAGVEAWVELEELDERPGFLPAELDVGRLGNPPADRGVDRG
jgi:hypothetical protein